MGDANTRSTTELLLALLERIAVAQEENTAVHERIAIALEESSNRREYSSAKEAQEPAPEIRPDSGEQRRIRVLWAMKHEKNATSIRQLAKLTGVSPSTLGEWPNVREFYGLPPRKK